jgi:hypothetical protein
MRVAAAAVATACVAFAIAAATGLGAAKDNYILRVGDTVSDPHSKLLCSAKAAGTTICTNGDINIRWTKRTVVVWRNRLHHSPTVTTTPAWVIYSFPTCTDRCGP